MQPKHEAMSWQQYLLKRGKGVRKAPCSMDRVLDDFHVLSRLLHAFAQKIYLGHGDCRGPGYCNAIAVDIFHSTEFPRDPPRLFPLLATHGRGRAQARKHGILLLPGDGQADRVLVLTTAVVRPVATPLSQPCKYHKISMVCKDTKGFENTILRTDA